jgi:arginase family enzyme
LETKITPIAFCRLLSTLSLLIDTLIPLIKALKITGIDIAQLAPMIDPTGNSSVVAAKLVRECLIAIGKKL